VNSIKLSNGSKIPTLGLGLWQIKDESECINAVLFALNAGYRHFDSAQRYENEAYLGKGLADSGIPREELFITTKIHHDNQQEGRILQSIEASLKNLQSSYVDLLLLHFPFTDTRQKAWPKLEETLKAGKAKAIGVSNYTVRHLEELLSECTIKPAVNQVELHVYLQQPELVAFCGQHDILVEAYSPLAHGYGLDSPVLAEVGKKYGKSPAQIMIRWCLEIGTVPLPKSVHEDRIKANIGVFDFKLDADDMAKLARLDKDYRTSWDPTNVA
jgi:diketogulonate reductase-like aldo/keto reductase